MTLHILGCYSATPRENHNPTAQLLHIRNHHFLIDCGEGTQVQLRKNKLKFSQINHIFISHLHGDHFFGLPGLISSFRLLGRQKDLHIYGPKGIKEAITLLLKLGDSWTNYPLFFHELTREDSVCVFEDDSVVVTTIPLKHRIYTNGFLFIEKPLPRKLLYDVCQSYEIDISQFEAIKGGADGLMPNGNTVPNTLLTSPPPQTHRYAYCSDTAYNPSMIPIIQGATAVYHEATFTEQHKKLAQKTMHSTAAQAAEVAKTAQVKQLILGHFSSRYSNNDTFLEEAKSIFDAVELAEDGSIFKIG